MYTPEQAYEFVLLFIAVWREARGEPDAARIGVAWVIRNRALGLNEAWYGNDWISVVLKPYQFSSFNLHDPNAHKFPKSNDPSFGPCMLVAKHVYEGTIPDPTFGSTYYYDDSLKSNPPSWAKEKKFAVKIGRLNFYKEPVAPTRTT